MNVDHMIVSVSKWQHPHEGVNFGTSNISANSPISQTQTMINRFKNVVNNVIGGIPALPLDNQGTDNTKKGADTLAIKHPYTRPDFLQLNADEVQVSADHISRPILVPRDITRIPWTAGYAEVINSGKTKLNEDQARAEVLFVQKSVTRSLSDPNRNCEVPDKSLYAEENDIADNDPLPFTYFAVFDGHAGTGAALMAVNTLHLIIQEELSNLRDLILRRRYGLDGFATSPRIETPGRPESPRVVYPDRTPLIDTDTLVIGALERAFFRMDRVIEEDRKHYRIAGGCTAVVALFFLGKLFVANAGDSRAIISTQSEVIPMSYDFTPETERARIQQIAHLRPELLHNEFTPTEFPRRISKRDIGARVLYRNGMMHGWALKTVTEEDTRFPLIYGEGKRTRLLATIGVSRGFGDHDLKVCDSEIYIKPFLSPAPEVKVVDVSKQRYTENDVLILGTDGLWDVTSNHKAGELVQKCLTQFESDERIRYTSAAQDLVMHARGLLKKGWRTSGDRPASGDDITAFVVPLCRYSNLQEADDSGEATTTSTTVHS